MRPRARGGLARIAACAALLAGPAPAETRHVESGSGDLIAIEIPRRTGAGSTVSLCMSVPEGSHGTKGFDMGSSATMLRVPPGRSGCRPVQAARQVIRFWKTPEALVIKHGLDLSGRGGGTVSMRWSRD